jgi:hypothetical protein
VALLGTHRPTSQVAPWYTITSVSSILITLLPGNILRKGHCAGCCRYCERFRPSERHGSRAASQQHNRGSCWNSRLEPMCFSHIHNVSHLSFLTVYPYESICRLRSDTVLTTVLIGKVPNRKDILFQNKSKVTDLRKKSANFRKVYCILASCYIRLALEESIL